MKGARCVFLVFLHYDPFWQSARTLFRPIHKEGTYSDPEVGFGVVASPSQMSSSPRLSFTAWPSFCLQPR
jgi:hypothetical protein